MATTTAAETPTHAQREGKRRRVAPQAPRVDIYETADAYVLVADVPGLTSDTLELITESDSLIIRGEAGESPAADYQEFVLGAYYRSFTLSDDLDTERATATLDSGVVRIEIPKSARVKPKRIPIRTD
jgi:HSP20 family molecular chaperone IbpA